MTITAADVAGYFQTALGFAGRRVDVPRSTIAGTVHESFIIVHQAPAVGSGDPTQLATYLAALDTVPAALGYWTWRAGWISRRLDGGDAAAHVYYLVLAYSPDAAVIVPGEWIGYRGTGATVHTP